LEKICAVVGRQTDVANERHAAAEKLTRAPNSNS
jgi:hypothetical protein